MARYIIATAALAITALLLGSCTEKVIKAKRLEPGEIVELDELEEFDEPADVFAALARMGRCATLVRALEATGLAQTLSGPGPFTLFAPTDEAFAALPRGRLDYLFAHPEELKAILLRHIVGAKMSASEVSWSTTIRTITGQKLSVTVEDGAERIDGAMLIERDMMATNGIIHLIDKVLAAPEAP